MEQPTKEQFLESIKNHRVNIVRDDGIHRHIVMSKGGSDMRYEIITCPWFLFYCGDMGAFTFRRLEDNFVFFRSRSNELVINPGYWHEKLEAVDRCNGSLVYSSNLFREAVKSHFEAYFEVDTIESETKAAIWARIEEEVLPYAEEHEAYAFSAVDNFRYLGKKPRPGVEGPVLFEFVDFWEANLKEYTYLYIWCLYAIVHAIMEYDKVKTS